MCVCEVVRGGAARQHELSGFVGKGPALFRAGSQCSRIALAGVYRLVAVCAARACVFCSSFSSSSSVRNNIILYCYYILYVFNRYYYYYYFIGLYRFVMILL